MARFPNTIHSTRVPYLGYTKVAEGLWRVIDKCDGRTMEVGPHYPTRNALLEDFDSYVARAWESPPDPSEGSAKVEVHSIWGFDSVHDFEKNILSGRVRDGFNSIAFNTQTEADAFVAGMKRTAAPDQLRICTAEEAVKVSESRNIKVRSAQDTGFDTAWDIDIMISDRWGDISEYIGKQDREELEGTPALLEALRAELFEELTFIVKKDGNWGMLWEVEYQSQESENDDRSDRKDVLKAFSEVAEALAKQCSVLALRYPTVEFVVPHPDAVYFGRPAIWGFAKMGALDAAGIRRLGADLYDHAFGPMSAAA